MAMRRSSYHDDDEPTRPDLLRPSLEQRATAVPPADDDSTMGMLMRQTVNNTTAIAALRVDVQTMTRELHQSSRMAEQDRSSIAAGSAKHASNRIAVLMGALFSVYEVSSPYLRELWRQVMHR